MSILDVEAPKHLSDRHMKQVADEAINGAAGNLYLQAQDSLEAGEPQHSVLQRELGKTPAGIGGFEFMDRVGAMVKARLERFYSSTGQVAVTYDVDFVEDEDRPHHGQWGVTLAATSSVAAIDADQSSQGVYHPGCSHFEPRCVD